VTYEVFLDGAKRVVELRKTPAGYQITLDGRRLEADAVEVAPNTYSILIEGQSHQIRVAPLPDGTLTVHSDLVEYQAEVSDPRSWRGRRHGAHEAQGRQPVAAPMPGKVVRLLVAEGDRVQAGQGLAVVEAMKMQNEIRSPKGGKVEKLLAREGQPVNAGEVLLWVE